MEVFIAFIIDQTNDLEHFTITLYKYVLSFEDELVVENLASLFYFPSLLIQSQPT